MGMKFGSLASFCRLEMNVVPRTKLASLLGLNQDPNIWCTIEDSNTCYVIYRIVMFEMVL
jgi:hypothetical protein